MTTAADRFKILYDVAGVPDLKIGVGDTGSITVAVTTGKVTIGAATLADPANVDMLQQVLEQARVDQARIRRELHPPAPGSREAAFELLRTMGASSVMANMILNRALASGERSAELPGGGRVRVTHTLEDYTVHADGEGS